MGNGHRVAMPRDERGIAMFGQGKLPLPKRYARMTAALLFCLRQADQNEVNNAGNRRKQQIQLQITGFIDNHGRDNTYNNDDVENINTMGRNLGNTVLSSDINFFQQRVGFGKEHAEGE